MAQPQVIWRARVETGEFGTGTCEECGAAFGRHSKLRVRFCSHRCANRAAAIERQFRRMCSLEWVGPKCRISFFRCEHCGLLSVGQPGTSRRWCHAHRKYQPRPARSAICQQCGGEFDARQGPKRFCSRACLRRSPAYRECIRRAKGRRRARKRNAFVADVSLAQIAERDGWRCQLCHKQVKREVVVPHPMSPTLDHVLPLAAGGTHEPANVHLAHFICNSLKGAGAAQLRGPWAA